MSGKAEKRGVSPMGSSTPTTERRRSMRPSTPPGTTTAAKDQGKAPATSSTTGKHVPNYLKPTISSNPDAAKRNVIKKHASDDTHKPTSTMMRRRSFDKPVPASQVHRTLQSSGSRSERSTPPFSPKSSSSMTRPGSSSSSSDRISKVIKALKSQPPLLKIKNMARTNSSSAARKETKTSNPKKATPTTEEESVLAPNTHETEAEDKESLDVNVEEELAKLESHVDLPHFAEDKEHIDEEKHNPEEHVDENKEAPIDTTVSEDHQVEQTPVEKNIENVDVNEAPVEEIQDVQESQDNIQHKEIEDVQESQQSIKTEEIQNVQENQQSIQADEIQDDQENPCTKKSTQDIDEASAEHGNTKAEEKDTSDEEKEATEEIKPIIGLTVKTALDETDEAVVEEEHVHHDTEAADKGQNSEESDHKISEDEKVASSEAENVVHKHQVGETKNNKESPAYNDVIEETASKLVEKRINKVRALAGAFETVISLQQPDSS